MLHVFCCHPVSCRLADFYRIEAIRWLNSLTCNGTFHFVSTWLKSTPTIIAMSHVKVTVTRWQANQEMPVTVCYENTKQTRLVVNANKVWKYEWLYLLLVWRYPQSPKHLFRYSNTTISSPGMNNATKSNSWIWIVVEFSKNHHSCLPLCCLILYILHSLKLLGSSGPHSTQLLPAACVT